jgi:hypothetical protein
MLNMEVTAMMYAEWRCERMGEERRIDVHLKTCFPASLLGPWLHMQLGLHDMPFRAAVVAPNPLKRTPTVSVIVCLDL